MSNNNVLDQSKKNVVYFADLPRQEQEYIKVLLVEDCFPAAKRHYDIIRHRYSNDVLNDNNNSENRRKI